MDIRDNSINNINIWDNKHFNIMEDELLTWFGNMLNFVIIIYLALSIVNTACFKISQISIAAFGLMVSILIQLRNLMRG